MKKIKMINKTALKHILRLDTWSKRIRLARKANDCFDIPKVENAGQVINWKGVPVQIMHNGVKIFAGCYHGAPMTKIIKILKGHHEPQEEKIFYNILQHIPDDGVMIEIGSFWSYYSLWFSYKKPKRKNFLIEPVDWKRLIGQLNFSLNGKEIAADAFYIQDPERSIEQSAEVDKKNIELAEPITIDEYLTIKNLKSVNVLHADIQGAEMAMLTGGEQALKNNSIDYIFISSHDDKHQSCISLLEENGYKILVEHSPEESFSEDGLIVAAGKYATFKDKIEIEHNG